MNWKTEWFTSSWGFAKQILPLLLAGPALSLPNMLVIRSVLGTKQTVVFVSPVVSMATVSGMIFGSFF